MQSTRIPTLGRSLLVAGLAIAISAASCAEFRTVLTGEEFERAPEDSPRVEVELVIEVEDAFYDDLEDKDVLNESIYAHVEGLADLGMRLYPILSSNYGENDDRPAYVMTVTVQTLAIDVKNKLIEEKDEEPYVESSVNTLDCLATASMTKRRSNGPAFGVGRGNGKGRVHVRGNASSEDGLSTFLVTKKTADQQILRVAESDLMEVMDEAVVDCLRELIKAVDRDLALSHGAQADPAQQ